MSFSHFWVVIWFARTIHTYPSPLPDDPHIHTHRKPGSFITVCKVIGTPPSDYIINSFQLIGLCSSLNQGSCCPYYLRKLNKLLIDRLIFCLVVKLIKRTFVWMVNRFINCFIVWFWPYIVNSISGTWISMGRDSKKTMITWSPDHMITWSHDHMITWSHDHIWIVYVKQNYFDWFIDWLIDWLIERFFYFLPIIN